MVGGVVRLGGLAEEAEGESLGRAVAAVCAGQDAAECSAAKAAHRRTLDLAASEERFRMLAEQTSDVITRNDLDGRFTWVSPAVRVVLGYEPEDLLGRRPRDFTHPDDRNSVISARPELLAEPDRTVVRTFRMRHAEGGYRRVEAASRWFKGESRDIIIVFRDVTRRMEAEQGTRDLRATDAVTGRRATLAELATFVAHELNQPLAALANYAAVVARLAAREDADRDRLVAASRRVHEEALRAQSSLEHVREFVRQKAPSPGPLELPALLAEAARSVAGVAEAAGVRLEVRPTASATRFEGDAVLLRQVLVNLLMNGIQAASSGPLRRVTLGGEVRGDAVTLRVADTGPRIPEAARARLFEPFHTTRPDGLGLGLVLSRSIIRAHGGTLGVEVPAAGDGLAFVAGLPRSSAGFGGGCGPGVAVGVEPRG